MSEGRAFGGSKCASGGTPCALHNTHCALRDSAAFISPMPAIHSKPFIYLPRDMWHHHLLLAIFHTLHSDVTQMRKHWRSNKSSQSLSDTSRPPLTPKSDIWHSTNHIWHTNARVDTVTGQRDLPHFIMMWCRSTSIDARTRLLNPYLTPQGHLWHPKQVECVGSVRFNVL